MSIKIKAFFRENPTMLLTLCYFIITAIGVLYSYFFYQEFGINILKFADLSDFLLASILEPLSLVVFALLVILSIFLFWCDIKIRKRFPAYGRFLEKQFLSKYSDPIGFVFMISVFTFALLKTIAINNSEIIKTKGGDEFLVQMNDQEGVSESKLTVLGSSSRYAYFYESELSVSLVVPVENIAFMKKNVTLISNDKTINEAKNELSETLKVSDEL
jgi:hypothetical protein